MPDKKPPTFTITADDPAFAKVVFTYDEAYQTRFELPVGERRTKHEEHFALIQAGRQYQTDHGIGKPKVDLSKRKWEKVE